MNTNRKADLQRKLGMAPVVKPPDGLSERIKSDIPPSFRSTGDRRRRPGFRVLDYRVAASLLVIIASAWAGIRLLSTSRFPGQEARPTTITRPASRLAQHPSEPVTPPSTAPLSNSGAAERVPEPVALAEPPRIPTPPAAPGLREEAARVNAGAVREQAPAAERQLAADDALSSEGVGGTARVAPFAPSSPPPASPVVASDSPVPATSQGTVAAAATAPRRAAEAITVAGRDAKVMSTLPAAAAKADDSAPQNARRVFGLSIDEDAFARVKSAIDRGESPAAASVDVEALVNYFAGAPSRSPHEVALDVEASQAPLDSEAPAFVIRTTVDTAASDLRSAGVPPALVTNARIETAFNSAVVLSHRRIGGGTATRAEASLTRNLSVTALYEVELSPDVKPRQTVAVIRLYYHRPNGGSDETLIHEVHVGDLQRPWTRSSRRHRLTSLGAVWGERLKGGSGGADVARKANELAIEEPRDARARELAAVATAFSRLQTSGSTGSGR